MKSIEFTANLGRRRRVLLAALGVGVACVLGGVAVGLAQPNSGPVCEQVGNETPDLGAGKALTGGRWIHVDPDTRESGVPAHENSLSAAVSSDPALSTSHQGLVEVPAPGGGVMVDLQGRFRSAVIARVKPDGTVVTECVQASPPAGLPPGLPPGVPIPPR